MGSWSKQVREWMEKPLCRNGHDWQQTEVPGWIRCSKCFLTIEKEGY